MPHKIGEWYQYSGAIHMHTTESDGTKSLEQIAEIGQEAGLDFMMVSDHMTLSNRDASKEGFYGKTLVVIGYEHNDTSDKHHYLIFGSPGVYSDKLSPKEYVAAAARDGAVGIIAHPDEIRNRMKQYPPYPWNDWSVSGFTGIELWNQMSEWMEQLTPFNKFHMVFSPRKSMIGPTQRILKKWDALNMKSKCAGVASVDAHAFPVQFGPLRVEIFPYKVHFRCIRTHILLDEPLSSHFETASSQLLSAIRDCRLFCSNIRWGDATGFEFLAVRPGESVTCGGWLSSPNEAKLQVRLPSKARMNLVHNGELILTVTGNRIDFDVSRPGIYRVEVWKGRRGWIFSNHIRVGN